jgi:hypothetical protein
MHRDKKKEEEFKLIVKDTVESPNSSVVAIVLEMEIADEYHILACIIWYHEDLGGSFIPLIAVLDCTGVDGSVQLSNKTFKMGEDVTHTCMLPKVEEV